MNWARTVIALLIVTPAPLYAQDCGIPAAGAGVAAPANWNSVTGGHFEAATISIPIGTNLALASDLTIVADGDVSVGGNIRLPKIVNPGIASPNITIASRNGTVSVLAPASIGGGYAAPSMLVWITARPAIAKGAAVGNGSIIRIIGASINVKGSIVGNEGGHASDTIAHARGPVAGPNNSANARGGNGGKGGDVLLCAERIDIGEIAPVLGGEGGGGGTAGASGDNIDPGQAWGGNGGSGGNVVFRGAQITLGGMTIGGKGGNGGDANADGGSVGGKAWSQAGGGGKGGTVRFENGAQVKNKRVPAAGDGGSMGGNAYAAGGKGWDGALTGGNGGDAEARAGNGGASGDVPVVPLTGGGSAQGAAGRNGSGGDANAYPGNGGDVTLVGSAGNSGVGMAIGGSNGAGVSPGPPSVARAVLGGIRAGGVAGVASQNGKQ